MILHNNATTNKAQRKSIQSSTLTNNQLSEKFDVSTKTISKWRNRPTVEDKSSRPNKINYSLTDGEQQIVIFLRQTTWLPNDELVDILKPLIPKLKHTNCYRTLKRKGINKIPFKRDKECKQFANYEPGFIHIDLTYLPRLEGSSRKYLYVAIDRATRLVYLSMKKDKSKNSSVEFLKECNKFYPYRIQKILTDNGAEFNHNAFRRHGEGVKPKEEHPFVKECIKLGIENRTTKIKSPWTNGMVERINKTLKDATVNKYTYTSFKELEIDLQEYVRVYNCFKKHNGIERLTPYQETMRWYKMKGELFKYHPNKLLKKLNRNNVVKHDN